MKEELKLSMNRDIRCWESGEYCCLHNELIVFMDNVLNTAQVPFEISKKRYKKTAIRNPLADRKWKSLAGFYKRVSKFMSLYFQNRVYSAELELFFDCFREFELLKQCTFVNPSLVIDNGLIEGEAYNAFIEYLRREAILRNVKKRLADWRGGLIEQADSIRAYIAALSAEYRTLVIVRVDFYYAEHAWDGSEAVERMDWEIAGDGSWVQVPSQLPCLYPPETAGRIDTAVAMRHRDRFFDNRRGADWKLFEHMVGYLTKMETGGRRRANHVHCFLFFDGTRAKDVDELVNRVRERWSRTANGLGMVYDSRNRLDKARLKAEGKWAIDPLQRGDALGLARLQDYAAGYCAKDDEQMVRVKPGLKARMLTMGRFPKAAAMGRAST